jgi:hypothetical protein
MLKQAVSAWILFAEFASDASRCSQATVASSARMSASCGPRAHSPAEDALQRSGRRLADMFYGGRRRRAPKERERKRDERAEPLFSMRFHLLPAFISFL